MAANTLPIYSKAGDVQWSAAAITSANTAKDGTGTVTTVFTAGVDGGRVEKLVFQPLGTNVATVARIFVNNGQSNATPANNAYFKDVTLPASTLSENASMPAVEVPLNLALPPGYRLLVTLGTAIAAGVMVTVVGGKY